MKKIFLIPLILLCLNPPCFSQAVVSSVKFEGNNFFSTNELNGAMVLKRDKNYNQNQFNLDLKSIRNRYRTSGYLDAKIKNARLEFDRDSTFVDITITIEEGEKILIGKIIFSGNQILKEKDVTAVFETKAGKVLDDNTLNNDIKALLALYESKGYPFAKAGIEDISVYEENKIRKLKISIAINELSKIQIDNVKISGNETTRDYVILRELKVNKDKKVTKESLDNMKERLDRLNIFEKVDEPKIYNSRNSKRTGLLINVKEGNTNTFDGIIGYVPPATDKEDGYLTGLVNVSFRNLFGTGRRIDAKWQQEVKATQELEFKYREPYFAGLPLDLNTSFAQRIQDTTYTKRKFDIKGDVLLTDKFTVTFIGGYDRVIPVDDSTRIFKIADSRILFSGFEVKYDSRDNIYIPGRGILFRTSYTYGDKKIFNLDKLQGFGFSGNFSLQKYTGELDVYYTLLKKQTNLLKFFAGEVVSDRIEDADYFRIGGNRNIRGYRDEQFLASKLMYSNIEPRYSLSRKSFFFTFFDFGYYYKKEDLANLIPEQEGFLYGFGAGIRIETALGIVGVSYALGKGDSFLDGKIHFGLINDF